MAISWSQTHVIVTQVAPADAGRWVDAAGKLGAGDMKAAIRGSAELAARNGFVAGLRSIQRDESDAAGSAGQFLYRRPP
ncbi:MAG: hypothetical protein IPM94_15190 [bacterium]|nr:hypothetical protein [bacterium]